MCCLHVFGHALMHSSQIFLMKMIPAFRNTITKVCFSSSFFSDQSLLPIDHVRVFLAHDGQIASMRVVPVLIVKYVWNAILLPSR
jgi:hypothetical protein